MSTQITKYFPFVLILFHIIGLYLFTKNSESIDLTWFNLLLCGSLVFFSEALNRKTLFLLAFIFLGGFIIEAVGVNTGLLFGEYTYGSVLGWKYAGVSLIIGLNWYAIVLSAANVSRLVSKNLYVQSSLAALLCTLMDYLIEPVAIKFGFWNWTAEAIPLSNYATWFVFSFIFSIIYLKNSESLNRTAIFLFFIWVAFFIILNAI